VFADYSEPLPVRHIDRGIVRRWKRVLSALLSIVGLAMLSFVAGATVMFFQAPSSLFLSKALLGARTWYDGEPGFSSPRDLATSPALRSGVDRPERTFDGYTLYACEASEKKSGTQAFLINMRGETVHRWAVPFSRLWPNPSHLESRVPDSAVCIFACHLYPNGDLLAVFHRQVEPHGCGLAKLDKDSKVLWTYGASIHHDVHVTEDGTIYTLQHKSVDDLPKGLERIGTPTIIDWLLMLSPEGKLLREPVSILGAFQDTPYAVLLDGLKWPFKRHVSPGGSTAAARIYEFGGHDPLHTNSVRVLDRNLATRFPLFKAGQVLLSIRSINVLAMLDPESGKIVWATRGPWYAQHDAQFLDNGHLLLYDNLGVAMGSRVLEYDPQTQAFPWSYGGPQGAEFFTSERGACQRFPNGNTLVVNSEAGEMIEVSRDYEVVWSSFADSYVTTARRYTAEELPFLEGQQVRP
jgi:hypothetical protein